MFAQASYMLAFYMLPQGIPGGSDGKESACQCKRPGFDLWVRKMPWRREWQPTPVFLPGESRGQRRLAGYSPFSHKESDTTEEPALFPGDASGKEPAASAGSIGDSGLIPGSGRSTPWRKAWQPTPVFSPGESHGQRSLAGYSP